MEKRTAQQNRALHMFFTLLAEKLNIAGLDMKRTLKPEIDIPWSSETVKEFLWRPIQEAQLKKTSTTELNTKEIDLVYDTITRHLAEKFGISQDFPSIESIMLQTIREGNEN